MRIRRSLPILLVVVVIAAALTLVVQLRKHAPPEAARLLPGADGFLYVNLQWMRRANVAGHLPEVSHDPEYQQFIEATGFQFERDLDEAAFAIHYPPVTQKSQPATADQARFSEVFVGKIQIERLSAYLKKLSASVENYRSVDVYNIPLEGRTVRVAILGVDTVAASNHSDPLVIRGIIDRSRKLASPFGGPSLLRQHYKHVPLASLAWAIFRVQPSSEPLTGPSGISFLFTKPAEVVASVRYLGAVHFRAEAFTGSNEEARQVTEQLTTFLNIFRTAESSVSAHGYDADVKQFLESLTVEQHDDRSVLSASVPMDLIRKVLAESPAELTPQPSPAPPPAPPMAAPKSPK
ncbi:MAG: hypothetical protein LAO03_15660 [Acidobacteriia bacterium]|nr:hypothetical protein [Terriglobia bacterium]